MDSSSFDRITRRLAVGTSRRGGIAALVASALGIAGSSAAEARPEPSATCEREGARCESDADCCSDRCQRKFGISRCAPPAPDRPDRDKKKRKKKKKKGGSGDSCTADGELCTMADSDCCGNLTCWGYPNPDSYSLPVVGACGTCAHANVWCDTYFDDCCDGLECMYTDGNRLATCQ